MPTVTTKPQLDNQCYEENIDLVRKIANRYYNVFRCYGIELDDCVQEGLLGLNFALTKFDPVAYPDVKFTSYAFNWIRKYVQLYIEQEKKQKLLSDTGSDFVYSLDYVLDLDDNTLTSYDVLDIKEEVSDSFCPVSQLYKDDEHQYLNHIIHKLLTDLELYVLQVRFIDRKSLTQKQLAKKLNLSLTQIRGIERNILDKLYQFLKTRIAA